MNSPQVVIRKLGKKPRSSVRSTVRVNSPPLFNVEHLWHAIRHIAAVEMLGDLTGLF